MSKVEEIYDTHVWKELEKEDAVPPEVILFSIYDFDSSIKYSTVCNSLQVYLNALGLLLRLDVRDALDGSFEDRLKLLAARLTDQVSHALMVYYLISFCSMPSPHQFLATCFNVSGKLVFGVAS